MNTYLYEQFHEVEKEIVCRHRRYYDVEEDWCDVGSGGVVGSHCCFGVWDCY